MSTTAAKKPPPTVSSKIPQDSSRRSSGDSQKRVWKLNRQKKQTEILYVF